MNAIPPSMMPGSPHAGVGHAATNLKWAALHDAANVVATLAGLEPDYAEVAVSDFPTLMRDAAPWRRELAERGIDEMTAAMEPGLSALLSIAARDGDPRAAALALWREFIQARTAVLALSLPASA